MRSVSSSSTENEEVMGIAITHPDRVLYPGASITKLDLARYYETVASAMIPYLGGRPLSLVRCPEGIGAPCFFQRHIPPGSGRFLHEISVRVKDHEDTYLMIDDARGIITLAQWGAIELHPWNCRSDRPDLPDRIIFDLDPGPGATWKQVMEAAMEVRERLASFRLESFLKTTGGKGLHVTVPLTRRKGWNTIKAFARGVAESMQRDAPERYIATASKEQREGKIFVDYLRNDLTATAVAPYSARARPGATVAFPISWNDLTSSLHPSSFTVTTVPELLARRARDPWAEFGKLRQQITTAHLDRLNIAINSRKS